MIKLASSTGLIALAFAAFASASPLLDSPSNAKGVEGRNEAPDPLATVYNSCVNDRQVAITLDDGPYDYAKNISDTLVAAGAKGTFFYNGNNFRCIYSQDSMDRVKYVVDHGHQVASHTWSHADLSTLTFDQIHDEMWRVEQALERIVGKKPAWMRAPYGSYNDLVREVAYQRGQSLAQWDFDSLDADGATVDQSKALYDQAIAQNPRNLLPLNHETHNTTAYDLLPYIIHLFQSRGYQLVTLAECLNLPAYQQETEPGVPDDTWQC